MKHRRRKIITRVIVFLLLGAIVNVAVAWGCALWIDGMPLAKVFDSGMSHTESPRWDIRNYYLCAGTGLISYDSFTVVTGPPPPLSASASYAEIAKYVEKIESWQRGKLTTRNEPEHVKLITPPSWSGAIHRPASSEINRLRYLENARGWPMYSMKWRQVQEYDVVAKSVTRSNNEWGAQLNGVQGPLGLPRVLPLRPIWPSFAINTIFYAAILGLLFFAPGKVRRTIRRRRELCPACAYPIGTSEVCTECGKPVKAR